MSDKLIRELLINVKQQGATKVAKNLKDVVAGLEDAAAASELTNEQLAKMPRTLYSIERAAERAAKNIAKINLNRGINTQALTKLENILSTLDGGFIELARTIEHSSSEMSNSIRDMANDTGRVLERLEDRMGDTARAISGTGRAFDSTAGAAGRASRAIGNTSGSSRGATRDFAAMAKIGGGLPIMYAAIASNVYVLQAAFEQLKIGDQLNRLEQFGTIVGATSGIPVQNLARALQEATGYAVSFEEAMRQASAAAAYGFTADQIKEFALVARRAAAVLGVDMTDALNRVIKGVSKQEIELMDELGITIRLNEAFADYVKQLNAASDGVKYNVQSLSSFQKQQAYANAVVAQSTKLFGNLDHVLRATPWEQFAANADTALKRVQMAAAKYLTPVANMLNNIFYQSKIAQMGDDAEAQAKTNAQIDPKNMRAMYAATKATKDALTDMEAKSKGFNIELQTTKDELDAVNKKLTFGTKLSSATAGFGLATGMEIPDDQRKLLAERDRLESRMGQLQKEQNSVMKTRNVLQANYQDMTDKMAKTYPETLKYIEQTGKTIVDPAKLNSMNDLLEGQASFAKNTASSVKNAMANIGDEKNLNEVAAALKEVKNTSEQMATISKKSGDDMVKGYGLGIESMSELNAKLQATEGLQKTINNSEQDAFDLEKKRNDLLASGMDHKKVGIEVSKLEVAQIDKQIAGYEKAQSVLGKSEDVEKKILELKTKKLQLTNSQYKEESKAKDRTDKILSVEKEIALLKNRTMTDSQYAYAQINMELDAEKEKYEWLKKQGDRTIEAERSRVTIANLERQQWQAQKQMNSEMASGREAALQLQQQASAATLGDQQRLEEQLSLYKDLKEATMGNSAAQEDYRKKIVETQAALTNLRAERDKQMQTMVGSSLGADYTPTTGLQGEDKNFADMQNKMSSYDTAISKLGELNSQAMAVGQSMGNLTNAMIQFSQGSLDTTSLIAAGMQTVSTMISYGANQQVSALDAAIAAEQKRDGKSEASKNKIKKMEAEKLKIQQDAAKKQIIIQTAVAVMQAATAVPYPFSIPLMVAAGLAGAMALAQASSASSMSSIGDSGGDTASYLTLGERQKNVDVSMKASGGEAAYMRGDSGIGNANSFVPRAEGGNMYPGVAYKMGEHGTEVATPLVPMKATSADDVSTGGTSAGAGRPIQLNIQAMDAQSFMDFALANPAAFRKAVESSLNEEGQSLNNLR